MFTCVLVVFLCYLCTLCVPSVLWYCWLGLLTRKTVARITYTVLVETLNPAQSINHILFMLCYRVWTEDLLCTQTQLIHSQNVSDIYLHFRPEFGDLCLLVLVRMTSGLLIIRVINWAVLLLVCDWFYVNWLQCDTASQLIVQFYFKCTNKFLWSTCLAILTANFVRRSEVIALQGPTRVCLKSEIHEIYEIQSLSRNPLSYYRNPLPKERDFVVGGWISWISLFRQWISLIRQWIS